MASSPTSIENQIDSFLEQFKRSASRAMEETAAHHQRAGSYNACSSSISRSRSGNLDLELLEAGKTRRRAHDKLFIATRDNGTGGGNGVLRSHIAALRELSSPSRRVQHTHQAFAISSGVLAGELRCDSSLRAAKSSSRGCRLVVLTSVEPSDGPSEPWDSRHPVEPRKLPYESRYNMEPVTEDNKGKMKANMQAAVKSKAVRESEVTNLENKKHEERKSVPTSRPKKTVLKVKTKKARNVGQTSYDPTKLEDSPAQVLERFKRGCECDDQCFKDLNPEVVYRHRLNIAELTKAEHDMYLMGVTMACLTDPYQTARHTERRRLRAQYVYQGRRVCLDAFLYLENCTHYQIKRIRKHLITHGVTPRVHGNHGKVPHNTFSLDIYKIATEFLKNFIEVQETKQKTKLVKNAPLHLPPDVTRKTVHDLYMQYCKKVSPNVKNMGYSTFRRFMKVQFPQVKFAKLEFIMRKTEQNHCTVESDARDDTGQRRSPNSEPAEAPKGSTILPLVITGDLGQNETYILTPIRKLQDCTVSYQVTTRGLIINSPAITLPKTKTI